MSDNGTESTSFSQASSDAGSESVRAALDADFADEVLQALTEMRRRCEELERVVESIAAVEAAGAAAHGADGELSTVAPASEREPSAQLGAVKSIARIAALSGASREKVELYLREELGLHDGTVEEVFRDAPPRKKRPR